MKVIRSGVGDNVLLGKIYIFNIIALFEKNKLPYYIRMNIIIQKVLFIT